MMRPGDPSQVLANSLNFWNGLNSYSKWKTFSSHYKNFKMPTIPARSNKLFQPVQELLFGEFRRLDNRSQCHPVKFIVKGDGNVQCSIGHLLFHPHMTAFLAYKKESGPGQCPDRIISRNNREMLQTATSIIRAPLPGMISSFGSRYREIASLIFCFASLIVRPCVIQPGREGTVTTYHPSSPLVITTFRFMVCLPSIIILVRTGRG